MTAETISANELVLELKAIRNDLNFIKKHMVDADSILSSDEKKLIVESLDNEKKGKLTSLEEIERARTKIR